MSIVRSLALLLALVLPAAAAEVPNILWIIVDDMSADFSCYGNTAISIPNVDRFAANGTLFSRAENIALMRRWAKEKPMEP